MIVAGFGFRNTAKIESLRDALAQVGAAGELTHLAVPADKSDVLAITSLADDLDLPLLAIGTEATFGLVTPTQSSVVLKERGTGSVAEAVALAAVGEGGWLRTSRCISADRLATCAVAIGGGA